MHAQEGLESEEHSRDELVITSPLTTLENGQQNLSTIRRLPPLPLFGTNVPKYGEHIFLMEGPEETFERGQLKKAGQRRKEGSKHAL